MTKKLSFSFLSQDSIYRNKRKFLEISEIVPPSQKKSNLDYHKIVEEKRIKT